MNKTISIDEFTTLVLNRKIHSNEKVKVSSDELLNLLKENIKLEKQIESYEKTKLQEDSEKDLEIRKLNFLLESEKSLNKALQDKVINLLEHEKIQRQRANNAISKLNEHKRVSAQDTPFSYTIKLI